MNLYLLKRDKNAEYDETVSAVIAAASYGDARLLAEMLPGDQPKGSWDLNYADCTILGVAAEHIKAGVILAEYRAG